MPPDREGDPNPVPLSIPRPKDNDVEDVSWALSTAEAMWGRGDRADAVKWVRRAAEAASEAEDDDRALELAKTAADLAQLVDRGASMPPPGRPGAQPGQGSSPEVQQNNPRASAAKINRNVQVLPIVPAAGRPAQPRPSQSDAARKARKSAHGLEDHAREGTPSGRATAETRKSSAGTRRTAHTPAQTPAETRRRRSTIPPPADLEPPPRPPSAPPPSGRGTEPQTAEEMEAWPTQALAGDALSGLAEEMTRISSPAFTEPEPTLPASPSGSARSSQAPPAIRPSQAPGARPSQAPGMRPSQAMRVVVWRSNDGVHVAPHGTTVSAITIDALLVALDPGADLASWLVKK